MPTNPQEGYAVSTFRLKDQAGNPLFYRYADQISMQELNNKLDKDDERIPEVAWTAAEKEKLAGIEAGAQVNLETAAAVVQDSVLPVTSGAVYTAIQNLSNQIRSGSDAILPRASTTQYGLVKIGSGLGIDTEGFLTAAEYVLPIASKQTDPNPVLGGIKIGDNLTIDNNGVVSAVFTLDAATDEDLGGVIVGDGLNIAADGTLSTASQLITLTQAEYDELTQEEQEDLTKFYFIIDGE